MKSQAPDGYMACFISWRRKDSRKCPRSQRLRSGTRAGKSSGGLLTTRWNSIDHEFDLVRVRPTDFLTPFSVWVWELVANALLDVTIKKIDTDCWGGEPSGGFWSIHKYNEQTQTLADVDDFLKQRGIGSSRYVETLEDQPLDLSIEPIQDALDGIRQAVEHPAAGEIFVLGWGDVCYPGSTAHLGGIFAGDGSRA